MMAVYCYRKEKPTIIDNAPGWIPTSGLALRRRALYATELRERELKINRCARTRPARSRLILNQRTHVVASQLLAPRQEFKFDDEDEAGNFAAQTLNQIDDRTRSAARRQQIVGDEDALAADDGVAVNLQNVLSVFEIVRDARHFGRQLLRFAHRHEARAERVGKRGREDKTARLDAEHNINALALEGLRQRVNGQAQTLRVLQQRRDVVEVDARLRKVRHFANEMFESIHWLSVVRSQLSVVSWFSFGSCSLICCVQFAPRKQRTTDYGQRTNFYLSIRKDLYAPVGSRLSSSTCSTRP